MRCRRHILALYFKKTSKHFEFWSKLKLPQQDHSSDSNVRAFWKRNLSIRSQSAVPSKSEQIENGTSTCFAWPDTHHAIVFQVSMFCQDALRRSSQSFALHVQICNNHMMMPACTPRFLVRHRGAWEFRKHHVDVEKALLIHACFRASASPYDPNLLQSDF